MFIELNRHLGVEPVCQALGVSASAYYQRASGCRSQRQIDDERLLLLIQAVHRANYECYGYPRVWHELRRQGIDIGRDRVARLMRQAGIKGAKRRGRPPPTTTPDPQAQRGTDLVQRRFQASRPNELWLADLTYLRCWEGLLYLAFIIDLYSRVIVGWQLASHMHTTLVLDALKMAIATRGTGADVVLIHHSDRGSQGGFMWSWQHLIEGGCDGQTARVGFGADWAAGDAFAGAAAGGAAGASRAVLERGRARAHQRGRWSGGGGVGGRWRPVVQRGWRDAAVCYPGIAVGALSGVRRA